jgi:hypothetical protein
MLKNCGVKGAVTLDCIFPLLANLIYYALFFAGTVGVVMVILGGIRFITSGGDVKKIEQAKKTLAYAVAGILLIMLSFFIVRTIGTVTGTACLNSAFSFQSCGSGAGGAF